MQMDITLAMQVPVNYWQHCIGPHADNLLGYIRPKVSRSKWPARRILGSHLDDSVLQDVTENMTLCSSAGLTTSLGSIS